MLFKLLQVKSVWDAAARDVKRVIAECDAARASGNMGVLTVSPKACSPIVASIRRAEAMVKTVFSTIEKC